MGEKIHAMDDPNLPTATGHAGMQSDDDRAPRSIDLYALLEDAAKPQTPEAKALCDAEKAFLRNRVFRDLKDLKPAFDSPEIAHFRAADFLCVIKRCSELGFVAREAQFQIEALPKSVVLTARM